MAKNQLGVAWVQIKPSLSGISNAVKMTLNNEAGNAGTTAGNTFSTKWAVAMGAVSAITSQVFQSVSNAITSNIDGAITRADTLERFPKVMAQLGYSTDDATAAIIKLRDGVQGVPTSLADVVSGTQRLVSVTKDVGKAADWSLAISDAMISNGASAERAAQAMEQFMQIVSRGKPTGQDWLTIMEVAPGTMQALAESLGYASATMGGDLYTALQTGKLSMDDFMNALVQMDKVGTGSMASLSELARTASGGIETAMTNMGQSIQNAIVDIIQEIGFENITNAINFVKDALVGLTKAIGGIIGFCVQFKDVLVPLAVAIGGVALASLGITKAISAFQTIKKGIQSLSSVFGKASKTISDGADKIADAVGNKIGDKASSRASSAMGKLGTSIKNGANGLKNGLVSVLNGLQEVLTSAVNVIVEPLKVALKGVEEAIAGFFTAFADPAIAVGALMFAAAAAAVAAAILMIGGAVGLIMPVLQELFNTIIMPMAIFIRDTLLMIIPLITDAIIRLTNEAIIPLGTFLVTSILVIINTITEAIIRLTNEAIIPLGTFLLSSFVIAVNTVADAIVYLTNGAVIPLLNTLSGAFIGIIEAVAGVITGTLRTALEGISGVIDSVGNAFVNMGSAIRNALDGVAGILAEFQGIIVAIGDAVIGVVALATHQSITYGHGFAHVTAAATGGLVGGVGTSTSDSNLFALSKGEYVIRASAAHKIGYDNLDQLNANGTLASSGGNNYFTINGYNKSPEELANIISHKIALSQRGVF